MTTEVQWSELQRDPKSVAALADRGDVRVRRRDGAPLLLIREDQAAAASAGALAAARTLRNALAHLSTPDALRVLRDEFPWVDVLPPADLDRFVVDFVRAVGAAAELGRWGILDQTVREWIATARVQAEPGLAARLSAPVDGDLGPVLPPGEFLAEVGG